MLYEIINPSDPYIIEADSLEIAFMACIILGSGQYAFEPLADGGTKIPLFFSGMVPSIDEWCKEHLGGRTTKEVIEHVRSKKRIELADCLDSCLIGKAQDRETYYLGLNLIDDSAKRERWWSEWHDKRRSSLNDIGGRAHKIAENFRKDASDPIIPAPQQVFGGR